MSATTIRRRARAAAAAAVDQGDYPFEHLTEGQSIAQFCKNPETRYPEGFKGSKHLGVFAGVTIKDRSAEKNRNGANGGLALVTKDTNQLLGGVSEPLIEALETGEEFTPVISLVRAKQGREGYANTAFFLMHKKGEIAGLEIASFDADGALDEE